ncbi:nucleoside-diphosphate sugar epimerase [Acinetobacter silvestris]|uniref:Nucleoside-diphosphate sugar epimerase n=1 Tax=Acinetobacter silvestris TaxID=1977882 RepID=A0A1Y3CDH2_9GAMM|nr:nucleoside-diphosphate sugar epimerase [Acinetobacter silvestris]OTG65097.1 nucleoside-diphosphate sugar epimerase [Acinetobacter silvestris]
MAKLIRSAIVIGATGLVGRELVKQLNSNVGCERITVVVRHEDQAFKNYSKVKQFILDDFLLLNDEDVSEYSHAFSCLGTTIKKAGSKQTFYNIDYGINAHFADLFEMTPTHFLLISAMGANSTSKIFYNKVKGELENYIHNLNLSCTSIFQPSLLLGERQEKRVFEDVTQKLYQRFSHLVPNTFKYKPVTAEQVAHTMIEAAQNQTDKFEIYDNLHIQNTK